MNSPQPNQQSKFCSFTIPCGAWSIRSDQKKTGMLPGKFGKNDLLSKIFSANLDTACLRYLEI